MKHVSMKVVDKKERKLALVIVDVQKKFFMEGDEKTPASAELHTPQMKRAIDLFRKAGRPVIWIMFMGPTHQEGITDDSSILLDGFEIKEGDFVVDKYHMNSFHNTTLADIIHQNECDAALFMGMYAQHCVMATYWGAFDKDVSPYMLKGGLISNNEEMCDKVCELCKFYTMEELEENLKLHKM